MTRHRFTEEERKAAAFTQTVMGRSMKLRREAELVLLNRLFAELAMPEMLPEL